MLEIKSQSSKRTQTSQSELEKQGKSGLLECHALKSRADKSENSSLGLWTWWMGSEQWRLSTDFAAKHVF